MSVETEKLKKENEALKKEIKSLKEGLDSLRKRVDSMKSDTSVGDLKFGGGAFEFMKEGQSVFSSFREIVKDTGTLLSPDGKLFSEIAGFGEKSVKLFGDIRQGLQATKDLQEGMRAFAQVGQDARGSLVELAIRFKALGVNMSNMNNILDSSIIGFGTTAGQAKELAEEVGAIGNATGVGMREAVRNFDYAQSRMAYSGDKLLANFKNLQLTSAQTGIGFQELTNAFGDSMDTFEGSASKAGNLNAILGRSIFNSIDLLGQTESERITTMVKGIRESVDVQALSKNKFQLKAVASGLGLSVDQTRRLLSGQMSVDDALKQKQADDPRAAQMKKMAEMLGQVNGGLEQFDYLIRRTRSTMDNAIVAANMQQRKIIQQGMVAITGATNMNPADFMRTLNEMGEAVLKGGLDMSQVQDVVSTAKTALVNQIKEGKLNKEEMKNVKAAFDKLKSTVEQVGDPRAVSPSGYGSFGVYSFSDKEKISDFAKFIGDGTENAVNQALKVFEKTFSSTTFKLMIGDKDFSAAVKAVTK